MDFECLNINKDNNNKLYNLYSIKIIQNLYNINFIAHFSWPKVLSQSQQPASKLSASKRGSFLSKSQPYAHKRPQKANKEKDADYFQSNLCQGISPR